MFFLIIVIIFPSKIQICLFCNVLLIYTPKFYTLYFRREKRYQPFSRRFCLHHTLRNELRHHFGWLIVIDYAEWMCNSQSRKEKKPVDNNDLILKQNQWNMIAKFYTSSRSRNQKNLSIRAWHAFQIVSGVSLTPLAWSSRFSPPLPYHKYPSISPSPAN